VLVELPRLVPATSPVQRILPNDHVVRVSVVANRHQNENGGVLEDEREGKLRYWVSTT
jgi:hypothetical protein